MTLRIRDATTADLDAIVAYNAALARETEDKVLDPRTLRAGVRALLADPSRGRYFLAEEDGCVVGQIMLTFEWSDWRNGLFWWIQSVYVEPPARGRRVFSRLYRHVMDKAEADPGVCGVRLYVDDSNADARAVYSHLGLVQSDYRLMEREIRRSD